MGYVSVSDNSIMEASLTISSAANRVHLNRSSVAGVDLFANNCDYCSDSDIPPVNHKKVLCIETTKLFRYYLHSDNDTQFNEKFR